MKKIAGYYRLSVEDDGTEPESSSIANQRRLIKSYVRQDAELSQYPYCEFFDDGYSGTTMDRPGMGKLLAAVKRGELYAVIVKDISRFSRDYIDLGTYMERIFPLLGIRFIAVLDHYDSKEHMENGVTMEIACKGLLADFYCKDVSAKVKSALEARRRMGKYAVGNTPFGYAKAADDKYQLVIVPQEAETIRYIFRLAAAGSTLTQICQRLNLERIPTPQQYKALRREQAGTQLQLPEKRWQAGMVRSILTNESYIGNMVYGKTKQAAVGSKKKLCKPKEEWKIFEAHHEAIVDRELFDALQTRFQKRQEGSKSNAQRAILK